MSFPLEIDNTMRETFVVCGEKHRRAHHQHLGPVTPSVHLLFGGCMAKGLEVARRAWYAAPQSLDYVGEGVDAAVRMWGDFDPPGGSYKTRETLTESIRYYFETWPLPVDTAPPNVGADGPEVEWWFRLPIPGLVHPDHGGPIYYCGRSDYIPNMGGLLGIEDDKSASTLGASWVKQWELDSQFTGYTWARREQGHECEYVLVRGISILKPKWKEIVCAEADATTTNAKGKPIRLEYNRAESFGHAQAMVYRPQWMVDRWLAQLQRDVGRMVQCYLDDRWDFALHKGACEAYGGCTFRQLCASQDPEGWAKINFVKRVWNPLAHV